MGRQKALLPWRGTTLIQYQIQALLDAGVAEVVVVLGYRAETLRPLVEPFPGAKTALNLRYRTGRSSSVRAGLRKIEQRAQDMLVLGVDQPRSAEAVRMVMEAHRRLGSLITYPAFRGKGGHPIIFSSALLPELMRIKESRQGLREIVERHRSDVVRLEVENAEVVLDLNRPEEYQQAMEEAGFS
ncbi:MAG: nucleotidyltransferase family protein, partial [Dehalococcoidia bacterium]|nr:nucleotidyltransferase family protein [Dehalococcoidia bacterium]